MKTAALAFVTSTATATALTPVIRHVARRRGALDVALSSRKIHGRPVPRLGGIAIVLAFYGPLLALLLVHSDVGHSFYADPVRAFGLLGGGLAVAALGLYDDLRGADARLKFAVQFAAAAAMYWLGFRIDHVATPVGVIDLGSLGLPFTMLWIAGLTNAMNLIDGLDGLAGGIAFIALAITFVLAAGRPEPLMMLVSGALAGAVLGFLPYNVNPASIFMGDTGSMFLGFVLATTAIQTNQKSSATVALLVPVLALGIPIADTLLAIARRAARGAPLFSADRGHIHHRLLDLGLDQRKTALLMYGASVVLGSAALVLAYASTAWAAWVLTPVAVLTWLGLRALGFGNLRQTWSVLEQRRRNLRVRDGIRRVGATMREARTSEEVFAALEHAADILGARAVALRVSRDAPPFSRGFERAGMLRVRFGLARGRGDGHIELGWDDGRASIDRDTEIAVEDVCEQVAGAISRVVRADTPRHGLARAVNFRR